MKARLSEIALTQIPSRLLEVCTIDKDYRTSKEATPLDYPELASLDMTLLDSEELVFDNWPVLQPSTHA